MDQIKGLFIDIDGVLIEDNRAIKGVVDTLNHLREKYKIRLLTNTTTKTVKEIHQLLIQLGFIIEKKEIITAPVAAKIILKKKGINKIYPVVNKQILPDFTEFTIDKNKPEAIIIGDIGTTWDFNLLNNLFKYMMGGTELIALHKSKFWKRKGELQLDIGMFVEGLEYATGKNATVIGKPSSSFFDAALQSINLLKHEIIMIGDDIDGDIGGAQNFGIKAFLVKTGKYNENFVSTSTVKPDKIIHSFNSLFEKL